VGDCDENENRVSYRPKRAGPGHGQDLLYRNVHGITYLWREGNDLITEEEAKDITSWAGTRNHAAQGEWYEVSDRDRIRLMLESFNLFTRQKERT
jgi:hypothetical protein